MNWTRVIALTLSLGVATAVAGEEFRIGGTGAALGTMRLLADAFTRQDPAILITTVPSLGSGGSIKAMHAGAIGLSVTSRPLKEAERRLGLQEIEYARTPFVFAVAARSASEAITTAELADIYGGRKTTWADGSRVRVVLRPISDIDTKLVKSISPEVGAAATLAEARPGVRFAVSDHDAAQDLETIPGAVGPSTLALIISEGRALRPLALNGVAPTTMAAASGQYPYFKRLFFVTKPKPAPAVARFITFVRSPAGRMVLERSGHWIP
ncbi:MAG: substrate-binding domain-containing protein [Burkholderiaceae bacterium]|nr:substrate-binding domain-containing protein [Burkholderiaceae bacterium]